MDFTIRLRAEGTAETRAQAEAVRAVRAELEKTQKKTETAKFVPRKVREAKEDRELDRTADRLQKSIIRDDKAREKADAKSKADAEKKAARESAVREKQRSSIEKDNAKRAASEATELARKSAAESKRQSQEEKSQKREEASRVKSEDRALEQKKKAAEREDKELERLASKLQKDLIKSDKDDQKKKKEAAKKADEDNAAKIDPSLKKLGATEKAKEKFFGQVAKGAMLAGAASGAALAGIAVKLAPLAIGIAGMARIQMISAQAGFNMRRLFMGTNPRPLLDALQRTAQLIDPRTFTGKALGDLLVRSSNGFFNMLAKAEPYARLFFKGMLLGALQVEGAWLQLQIAIQPVLNMFPKGTGLMTAFGAGALVVKAAFGLMGAGVVIGSVQAAGAILTFGRAALVATAPMLPLIVATVAWTSAISGLIDIVKEWDENSLSNITEGIKNSLGLTSDAEYDKNLKGVAQGVSGDDYDKKYKLGKYAEKPAPVPRNAEKQAAVAGPPIGKNLGLGIVAGMKDVQGKVEAGGRDLVLAAEGGAKAEAEIRSPAAKWRREIGRNLGAGAALGLEDSAGAIEEAGRAAMPSAPGVGGGVIGKRSGVVIQQITIYGVSANDEAKMRRIAIEAFDDAAERIGALA